MVIEVLSSSSGGNNNINNSNNTISIELASENTELRDLWIEAIKESNCGGLSLSLLL